MTRRLRPERLLPRMDDAWANYIIAEAARMSGVKMVQIMRPNLKRWPTRARHAVIWVMRMNGHALTDIAEHLGMSDHTSILYADNAAERLRENDVEFYHFSNNLLNAGSTYKEDEAEAA
jgi:chromosomal replication initiation ATPase DnaA